MCVDVCDLEWMFVDVRGMWISERVDSCGCE